MLRLARLLGIRPAPDGQRATHRARYDDDTLTTGRTFSLGRYYGAVAKSYQVTPLLKAARYAVTTAGDARAVVWPRLDYSVAANLDLVLGLQ